MLSYQIQEVSTNMWEVLIAVILLKTIFRSIFQPKPNLEIDMV